MITLYKDRDKNFECSLKIDGASLKDVKARVLLETKDYTLLFPATVNSEGICSVALDKQKMKLFPEGYTGNIKLEVIVENDTYFEPYSDSFIVEVSKKVVAEVIDNHPTTKKKIIVEAFSNSKNLKQLSGLLLEGSKKTKNIRSYVKQFAKKHDLSKKEFLEIRTILKSKSK